MPHSFMWHVSHIFLLSASSSLHTAHILHLTHKFVNIPGCSLVAQTSVYNAGEPGSSPGLGRSLGEGNGNPLQNYCLENPMDREAW